MKTIRLASIAAMCLLFALPASYGASSSGTKAANTAPESMRQVYRTSESLTKQHEKELAGGLRYRKLMRGNPMVRGVALTFDGGPHPQLTPKILGILKKYGVKGSFFVVGKQAEKYPKAVKSVIKEGHMVGCHSYDNIILSTIPAGNAPVQWEKALKAVKKSSGQTPRFCRPPGGYYNGDVLDAAVNTGLTPVFWTDDPAGYSGSPDDLAGILPGSIILLRDSDPQTQNILPRIITVVKSKGFQFYTIDEMARYTFNEIPH